MYAKKIASVYKELPLTFLIELMQQLFIRGVFIYPSCCGMYSMGMEFWDDFFLLQHLKMWLLVFLLAECLREGFHNMSLWPSLGNTPQLLDSLWVSLCFDFQQFYLTSQEVIVVFVYPSLHPLSFLDLCLVYYWFWKNSVIILHIFFSAHSLIPLHPGFRVWVF